MTIGMRTLHLMSNRWFELTSRSEPADYFVREGELDAKQLPAPEGADEPFYFDSEDGLDYFKDAIDTSGRSSSNLIQKAVLAMTTSNKEGFGDNLMASLLLGMR